MEVHQDSMPKPHFSSFFSVILIAVAVGAYGGLMLCFLDPPNRVLASALCWFSLSLLLGTLWDLKVRTKKRKDRFVRDLRAKNDRYYRGEQAFGFDQDRWTHETQDGKHEAPWAVLRHAVERSNTFALWTKTYFVIVPKRVLNGSSGPAEMAQDGSLSLDALRAFAWGQYGNSEPCSVGLVDYVTTEVPSLWSRRRRLMAQSHAAGVLFFVLIADGARHSAAPGATWGWTAAGLILFLTITAQFWYFVIQYLTSFKEVRDPWTTGFSGQGILRRNSKMRYFSAWAVFTKFRETRRCFLLYTDSTRYDIYPKRCFSVERQLALRALFQAKLALE